MYGKKLVASAYSWPPYVLTDDDNIVQGGVAVDIFRAVAKYYNFDYYLMPDDVWFSFFDNGTIGGSYASVIAFNLNSFQFVQCLNNYNVKVLL